MTGEIGKTIATAVHEATAAKNGLAVAAALNCIEPAALAEFFHVRLTGHADAIALGTGLPASPGAASGAIVLSADAAMAAGDQGRDVILVRSETTPDDVLGMQASRGILTVRGGLVSHAAVVARGWGIPAVVGAADVHIDGDTVTINDTVLRAGDEITIDGSTGEIYAGRLETFGSVPPPELDTLLAWADTVARGSVQVRANADTEGDASHGRELGAQGIGLCRTEHMFLAHDRLPIMRRYILSNDPATEQAALDELEAAQVHDFERLLDAMDALPVTVRLLDPPLHEFLPDLLDLTAREANGTLTDAQRVELTAVRRLHETNPMIGTRGVRLGLVRSGLYQMQVRALCQAAAKLLAQGKQPRVEIMIPLVVDAEELRITRKWVCEVLDELGFGDLSSEAVTVGAMIETPRAALTAKALAEHADFFSFGTNDLTQMTYAFSRDDVEARLLPAYQSLGILDANPFAELDQDGVGELVRIGCEAARSAKSTIKLGVCGEHAGHPASADFLVRLGVDSVSCSPFRVPMARLGVAQALLACGRVHINDIEFSYDATASDEASSETDGSTIDLSSDDDALDISVEVDEALVLHTMRVRGFVTSNGFKESIGSHPADLLDQLIEAGHVRYLEARDMFSLMPGGRERQEQLLADYATPDLQSGLAEPYHEFLTLNDEFKQLCTEWQMRGDQPNDHADAEYDQTCVDRLSNLAQRATPVVESIAAALPRFARYNQRLGVAADLVANGETKRFTGVMCESFHDIWMELHEDLIVLQGIDRKVEGSF
ncbi:MAG: putative PEP-binding protein [Acidimicrobiales bacterium]